MHPYDIINMSYAGNSSFTKTIRPFLFVIVVVAAAFAFLFICPAISFITTLLQSTYALCTTYYPVTQTLMIVKASLFCSILSFHCFSVFCACV